MRLGFGYSWKRSEFVYCNLRDQEIILLGGLVWLYNVVCSASREILFAYAFRNKSVVGVPSFRLIQMKSVQ